MSRILVVDDEWLPLSVVSRVLINEGYEVDQATNMEEAKKKIAVTDYVVIITDMNMPDTSGSQIVKTLKRIKPNTEIIVMTGYGTLDTAVDCMRAGAIDFIIKPPKRKQLKDAVAKTIQKKEISHENLMLRGLNEMKDKFLTLVSHELRTPLTLIYGYLTILQRQSFDFSEEQVGLLNIVMKSSKQLISLVNNIQTIAQADSGEMKIHYQSLQPDKLLSDVLAEMKASLNKRKLNIQMVAPEGMEAFSGDRIRLHQSLSELVQNSVRNTKDGGEIVLGAKQEDGTVIFSVRDNGIGISEEEQGKIFEPFYEIADVELHTTSSSKFGGGGMGIGLPLVKRVVEAHGGTIRLDSALGKGACFEIVLPAGITPVKNGFHDKLLE
jgi:two-component system, sensor histidine kinase and response regulator